MNAQQVVDRVIHPALQRAETFLDIPYTEQAQRLVTGTGWHESGGFEYIYQFPNGPAIGLFQAEPDTIRDYFSWADHRGLVSHLLDACAMDETPEDDDFEETFSGPLIVTGKRSL